MSIRTKVVTFSELMEFEQRPYLVIPNYQRPYSWGVEQIEALFDTLARHPATARLVQRTLLLEQPLPRHLALQQSLVGARIPVPVIGTR
jgi:hypothetical protein